MVSWHDPISVEEQHQIETNIQMKLRAGLAEVLTAISWKLRSDTVIG